MSNRESRNRKSFKTAGSKIVGRETKTGHFVPLRETAKRPSTTSRERIPLPEYGEASGSGYKTSPSGRYIESERQVVVSSKGEKVIIYRDARTGAFSSRKSAETIRKVSSSSAESLKRLAKR